MQNIDYSIYYKNWHNETETHADKMANWILNTLKPHVPTDLNAKVIDVGCGFGFSLRAMKKLGFNQLMGIEISEQQAAVAKKFGFNIVVVTDTINYLKNTNLRFDFVILFDVLEHIEVNKQIEFLASIYSVMNPGGKIVVTTPNANAILSARWRYNDYTHFSSFTEQSLNFVLKNAGFDSVKIDNEKGIGRLPKNIFRKGFSSSLRKYFIRYFWLQIFKSELPYENLEVVSFELNLFAVAQK